MLLFDDKRHTYIDYSQIVFETNHNQDFYNFQFEVPQWKDLSKNNVHRNIFDNKVDCAQNLDDFWFSFSHPIHNVEECSLYAQNNQQRTQKKQFYTKQRSRSVTTEKLGKQNCKAVRKQWNETKLDLGLYRKYIKTLVNKDVDEIILYNEAQNQPFIDYKNCKEFFYKLTDQVDDVLLQRTLRRIYKNENHVSTDNIIETAKKRPISEIMSLL